MKFFSLHGCCFTSGCRRSCGCLATFKGSCQPDVWLLKITAEQSPEEVRESVESRTHSDPHCGLPLRHMADNLYMTEAVKPWSHGGWYCPVRLQRRKTSNVTLIFLFHCAECFLPAYTFGLLLDLRPLSFLYSAF